MRGKVIHWKQILQTNNLDLKFKHTTFSRPEDTHKKVDFAVPANEAGKFKESWTNMREW